MQVRANVVNDGSELIVFCCCYFLKEFYVVAIWYIGYKLKKTPHRFIQYVCK